MKTIGLRELQTMLLDAWLADVPITAQALAGAVLVMAGEPNSQAAASDADDADVALQPGSESRHVVAVGRDDDGWVWGPLCCSPYGRVDH